jgi:hypothetical protein
VLRHELLSGESLIDFIFASLILLYLAPMAIAHKRSHPSAGSIEVLNILLGWTLIGWVVALIWARTVSPVELYVIRNGNPPIVDDYLSMRDRSP